MGKIKNRLYKFMYGRYGMDTLGKVILVTYVVILLVHTVVSIFLPNAFMDVVVFLVSVSLATTYIWRAFSRKTAKRRAENEKFCAFFKLRKNKFRDRKTHVYRECPKCKAMLRLPKSKGKHNVVCPRCKERFQVKG